MPTPGLEIKADPAVWYRLKRDLSRFEPGLRSGLRARLTQTGKEGRAAVQRTLRRSTPAGNPSGPGRAALAAATKVRTITSRHATGVEVSTTADQLPPEHRGLLYVYNKTAFRHPVFGMHDVTVTQRGRPYFEAVLGDLFDRRAAADMDAALDRAIRAIGGRP